MQIQNKTFNDEQYATDLVFMYKQTHTKTFPLLVFICRIILFFINLSASLPAIVPTQFPGHSTPTERGRLQSECWKLVCFKFGRRTFNIGWWGFMVLMFLPFITRFQKDVPPIQSETFFVMLPCFCLLALCYRSYLCLAVRQRRACHSGRLAIREEGRRHQFA